MAEGFFDFQKRVGQQKSAAGNPPKPPTPDTEPLTVTRLSALIEKAIKAGVPSTVSVRGELSNVSNRQASGHIYFTLKDSAATINAVMWRDAAARLTFNLEDGMEMIITGRVALYAPQGRYQLVASALHPIGQGALELAFRQLRAKLEAEGLFNPDRKKPIPLYPARLAMITSKSTAALQDMLKVLRRFAWLKLMLYHVPVQGEGSADKIAAAIAHLNCQAEKIGGVDVILLGRGGGSLEDLWSFNEESVARAVAASQIPIITGIGHEVDVAIADLVADHHAHTPTEAAQVATQHWKILPDALGNNRVRLNRGLRQIVQESTTRFTSAARHEFFRRPTDRIQTLRQLLDDRQRALSMALISRLHSATRRLADQDTRLQHHHPRHQLTLARHRTDTAQTRLAAAMLASLQNRATHLDHIDRQLQAISPTSVLRRGYTITTLEKSGQILRSAENLKPGNRLMTRFADGQIESIIPDNSQPTLFDKNE